MIAEQLERCTVTPIRPEVPDIRKGNRLYRCYVSQDVLKRGLKLVVMPDGAAWAPRTRVDNAMVKAPARAFRWRKMLDAGVHATLEELARTKGVTLSYVSRVPRLKLLSDRRLIQSIDPAVERVQKQPERCRNEHGSPPRTCRVPGNVYEKRRERNCKRKQIPPENIPQ